MTAKAYDPSSHSVVSSGVSITVDNTAPSVQVTSPNAGETVCGIVRLQATAEDNSDTVADEVCVGLLRRLEKQRKESIEAFSSGGREDRADAERAELAVIEEFLPSLADEAQTRRWVEEAIASIGASEPGDVGRVMGAVMKAHKGEVDGGLAKTLAAELLSDVL